MRAGKFITFEGGEGSGKSTQAKLLAQKLQARGLGVVLTREPGGSPFAEEVRALLLAGTLPPHPPLAEALLFYAARADHLEATIRPALRAGTWVICDRFSDSTRVYQGAGGGLDGGVLAALDRLVVGDDRPDLTAILDVPPAEGLARAEARSAGPAADPFERRSLAFHERLRAGYRALAVAEPARCVLVDGTLAPEAVAAEIWREVQRRLLADAG
jgi:dTMP kinase